MCDYILHREINVIFSRKSKIDQVRPYSIYSIHIIHTIVIIVILSCFICCVLTTVPEQILGIISIKRNCGH